MSPMTGPMLATGEELAQRAFNSNFDRTLGMADAYESMKTVEKTTFDGRPAYKLELKRKGGGTDIEFYDVATGLKSGSDVDVKNQMGTITAESTLSDYKKFGDIMQPTVIKQSASGTQIVADLHRDGVRQGGPGGVRTARRDQGADQVKLRRGPVVAAGLGVALWLGGAGLGADVPKGLETFDAAWTIVRDTHFDKTFNGVDWEAAKAEFRPKAAAATTTAELRAVLRSMLARLGQSHFSILPATADGATAKTSASRCGDARVRRPPGWPRRSRHQRRSGRSRSRGRCPHGMATDRRRRKAGRRDARAAQGSRLGRQG